MVFNVVPTALEVSVVSAILGYNFGAATAGVAVGTIGAYVGWTVGITQWRTQFRRNMNLVENKAGGRISDSLINYEAVKMFTAEKHEVKEYGGLLQEVRGNESRSEGQSYFSRRAKSTSRITCAACLVSLDFAASTAHI